jgi:N-acetylmuramic acid 6-phosphate (MurNAc-6-P) etherase
MLRHLTGRSRDEISAALATADGSVKLAALLLKGCDLKQAQALLERAGGQLRVALAAVEPRAARPTVLTRTGKSG